MLRLLGSQISVDGRSRLLFCLSRCHQTNSHVFVSFSVNLFRSSHSLSRTLERFSPQDLRFWLRDLSRIASSPVLQLRNLRQLSDEEAKRRIEKLKTTSSESKPSEKESGGERNVERDNEEKENNDDSDEEKRKKALQSWLWLGLAAGILLSMLARSDPPFAQITWSEFTNRLLPSGQIASITVFPSSEVAVVTMYKDAKASDGQSLPPMVKVKIPSVDRLEREVRAAEAAIHLPPELSTRIVYKYLDNVEFYILLLFLGGCFYLGYRFYKRGTFRNMFNIQDMMGNMFTRNLTIIDPHTTKTKLKIKFKDVAGLHEAKQEIQEFVDYLKSPAKYTKLGAKLPKGALLTGPPGCGKTLLAKALAAESSAPFISVNGTEFIEVIGGLGASRIRDLFKTAKARAPCIIYIDEIDAVGRKRSEGFSPGDGEADQTLNQLLVEMDGMDSAKGVIILASTNRADILDKALLRPGRFDRHILVDLPTALERKELFELYLKDVKLDKPPEVYSKRLSQMTPGFSGADIANVVNESAIRAATDQKTVITVKEIDYALQRILAGAEKRSQSLVKEEKEIVAYHEAGHALVGWLLEYTDALLKVSIIPRTSAALGFAQYAPRDRKLFSKEELFDRMCMALGGRAAENVIFGRISTGAQDDLDKVTKSAYAQVKTYGMSEKLGPLSFPQEGTTDVNADFLKKPFSGKLQHDMDQEASSLVSRAYFATEELLRANKSALEKIAKSLLEKEVLTYDDVKRLIGPPKYGEKQVIELTEKVLPKTENTSHT